MVGQNYYLDKRHYKVLLMLKSASMCTWYKKEKRGKDNSSFLVFKSSFTWCGIATGGFQGVDFGSCVQRATKLGTRAPMKQLLAEHTVSTSEASLKRFPCILTLPFFLILDAGPWMNHLASLLT